MGIRVTVAAVFVLLAVAIGAGIALRNEIAPGVIEAALHARGVDDAEVGAVEIGLRGVVASAIRIGAAPDLAVDSLRVEWTRASLRRRRLASISARGVRLAGRIGDEGAGFGELDALLPKAGGGGGFRLPALPADRIALDDAVAEIETADGPMRIAANLAAGESADHIDAHADLDAVHPGFDATLRLRGAGSANEIEGTLALDVAPRASAAKRLAFAADAMSTSGRFRLSDGVLSLDVDPFPFGFTMQAAAGSRRIEGRAPRLRLRASRDPDAVHVEAENGELRLRAQRVEASGFIVSADLGATSRGRIRIQKIRDLAQPARWPALAVDSTFETDGQEVDFEVHAADARGRLGASATGRHTIETGAGRAKIRLRPVHFAEAGLQPGDLLPGLANVFRDVEGDVEAVGELTWRGSAIDGTLDVALRDISGRTPAATLDHLNAAVRLDGLSPPKTAAHQLISIARVDFGLDLTDGVIDYRLRPNGTLDIAAADWKLAGGTVRTSGTLDPAATEQRIVLNVDSLDLATLLARVNLSNLSGTGKLSGRLPIVRREGAIEIRGGVLASVGTGVVRYRPQGGLGAIPREQKGLDVLLGALEDLHYDEIEIRLDGEAAGDITLKLHIRGSNPNFQKGRTVEFNLSVEAQLADLIQDATAAVRIPAEIERRLGEISAGR